MLEAVARRDPTAAAYSVENHLLSALGALETLIFTGTNAGRHDSPAIEVHQTGESAAGTKVDVVVTTEPSGSGPGRTYVAAAAVPLLALGPGADGPGPGGAAAATLGLTKRQALRLIAAESFARKLTLLPEE